MSGPGRILIPLVIFLVLSPFIIWIRLAGLGQPTLEDDIIFWAAVFVLGAALFFAILIVHNYLLRKMRERKLVRATIAARGNSRTFL